MKSSLVSSTFLLTFLFTFSLSLSLLPRFLSHTHTGARLQLKLVTHAFELDKILAQEEREKEHGRQQERLRQRRQQLLAKRDSTPTSTPRGTGSGLASETPTREAAPPADDHQARESEDVRVGHSLLELAAGADPRLVASASAAAVSFAATSSAKEASLPSTDLGGEGTEARRLYSYMRRAGHPITPHKVKRLLRKFDGRTGELFARLEQKFGVAEADPAATGAAEDERPRALPLLSSAAAFAAALDHALGAARSAAHAAVAAAERAGANAHDEVFLTAAYKRLAVTLLGKSARNWEQLETVWRIYATASEEGNEGGIDAAAVRWERRRDVGRARFCSQLYIICLALFPHPHTHTPPLFAVPAVDSIC